MAKVETGEFIAACKRALGAGQPLATVCLCGGPGERTLDLGDAYVAGPHEVARVLRALADYVETPVR